MDSVEYANPNATDGLNLYAYCGNNPVMNVDPTGTLGVGIAVLAVLLFTPIGGIVVQTAASAASYVGVAVKSIRDKDIRSDMNAIGWNPFNTDETAVINSKKVSFYKGAPVFRTSQARSGTFCAIFLNANADETTLKHEYGHIVQQLILGPVYYALMIGLPSWLEWSKRSYYARPWEITADILGGVTTRTHNKSDIAKGFWYLGISSLFGPLGYLFLIGEL